MAQVALEHVSKVYPDGTGAVADLDLTIDDGEFLVLVGPSGCGKTTALRMIAGLEEISAGQISIGDRVVNNVPPRDRDVAMVFQSYALYPHLTVGQNIGFGLSLRKMDKREIRRRVQEAADVLGLGELLDRKPRNLSGGQRQRVAMGRAIVRQPQVFLMDEPLSNLDAKLRVQMRAEIARLQLRLGVTTIYVTHDQTEAMTLGDRVAVMNHGVLQQVAPPQELYDRPLNVFVGGFIGSPAMNLLEGRFEGEGRGLAVVLGPDRLPVDDMLLVARPGIRAHIGKPVIVGIRPEDMFDAELAPDRPAAVLGATAELVEAMGSDVMVHFSLDVAPAVNEDIVVAREHEEAAAVSAGRHASSVIARFNPRTAAKEGKALRVGVDTKRLHVFDRESGRAVWD